MARAKRKSSDLDAARQRLAGIKQIKPKADLGPDLSIEDYEAEIKAVSDELDGYNGAVAEADDRQNKYETKEAGLRKTSTRVLTAIEARYGVDSSEYELAGGTRMSERKRKKKAAGGGSGSSTT